MRGGEVVIGHPLRARDPRRLGRWRPLTRLGEGGMGVVYLAIDGAERAAVKTVLPQLVTEPGFRQRFEREAAAARAVRSPRVAAVLEADLAGDPAYLAFEFVDGPTLWSRVAEHGPLAGDELVAFAAALADGLRAIHSAGVTHRDVKPTNIVCTSDGPVIIDFGVATLEEATSLTATGVTIGSAGWMSPEQAAGRSVTAACDLFSWAATVAYAASGQPPFGVGRPEAVIYRVLHQHPEIPALPFELDRLVRQAFAEDPVARPSAHDVLVSLTHQTQPSAVSDEITTRLRDTWTMPRTAAQPTPKRPRRGGRAVPATAAVITILFAAATAVFLAQSGDDASGRQDLRSAGATSALTSEAVTTSTSPPRTELPITTTTTAISSVRDVDFRNRTYQLDCGSGVEAIPLVDGGWQRNADPADGGVDGVDVIYADVVPPGAEEAVVTITCYSGANRALSHTFIYKADAGGASEIGRPLMGYPVLLSDLVAGGIDVYNPVYYAGTPRCCPDAYERAVWAWRDGEMVTVMVRTVEVEEVPEVESAD